MIKLLPMVILLFQNRSSVEGENTAHLRQPHIKWTRSGKTTTAVEKRPLPHLLGGGPGLAGSSPMPSDRGAPHSTTLRAPWDQPNK